jgi:hypothetical protein
MSEVLRISSPSSETWVAWTLLLLLLLAASNHSLVMDMANTFRGLFSRGERSYATNSIPTQVLSWIYKIGIVAMAMNLLLYQPGMKFGIGRYALSLASVAGMFAIQQALSHLTATVFLSHRQYEGAMEQRRQISNTISLLTYPIVVVMVWQNSVLNNTLCIALSLLWGGLLLIKGIQLSQQLSSILYILLYFITLEFIPLAGCILWLKHILQ